jgi:signal transduction histidine kinase
MPIPVNEKFDLAPALRTVVEVFENDGKSKIDLLLEEGEFLVHADEKLISRTVSNLIINGRQSYTEGHPPVVSIQLSHNLNHALVVVSDQGAGIPLNIQHKIFLPNFTTKETGSGIGLAVAKRGVEHAGGKIWFETVEGKGTKFFIELPLVS